MVRPFPRAIPDPTKRDALWHKYREDLISQAGIALYLFGNKSDATGTVVLADGVRKEFEIAKGFDLVQLPVGSTGYVAEQLAKEVQPGVDGGESSEAFKTAFAALQVPATRPQELIGRIEAALEAVAKF